MEAFSWLLISDLHLKADSGTWGQSVVLRDMVRDMEARKEDLQNIQFIIVSGDLAFSGSQAEYLLVEAFLDDLRTVVGLDRSRVFFVPGNHDISRGIQTTCYSGARDLLNSPQALEQFLATPLERDTLLQRLSAFIDFDTRFCEKHDRQLTDDRLAFVAPLKIDGLPICIAGLNSAWLCGDDNDQRKILVGDRPVIDVIEMIRGSSARLVVGVLHHPPDWLRNFDQRSLEERFLPECDFMHRGHLHEPNVQIISQLSGRSCILIAAGAGHAGREFDNCYSVVTFEPKASTCQVSCCLYDGRTGRFRAAEPVSIPIRLRGEIPGSMAELADSIGDLVPEAKSLSPYLASLLHGSTSDVPICVDGRILFALPHLLRELDDAQSALLTKSFLQVRNMLLAFADEKPLADRIAASCEPIRRYAVYLKKLAQADPDFAADLEQRSKQAQILCGARQSSEATQFTTGLLADLVSDEDWAALEMFARRYAGSSDERVTHLAKRRLALALARSDEPEKHREGKALAVVLASSQDSEASDYELAVTVCHKSGDDALAKKILLTALERFPMGASWLFNIGYRLVIDTGDAELRQRLDAAKSTGADE